MPNERRCVKCGQRGLWATTLFDHGPKARLLTQPDGYEKLRRMMYEEIGRRKKESA